jgi:hypothetical protein
MKAPEEVSNIEQYLQDKYFDKRVQILIDDRPNYITLDKIVVPKERR